MTTDPTPPTPVTQLVAEAFEALGWNMGRADWNLADAEKVLAAHAPLRDVITRGLALTPERLVGSVATLIHNHIGYTGEHLSIHSCACDHIARAWFAALTPEATDAAVR